MFDKDKDIDTLKKENNIKISYTTSIENNDFEMLDDDALYRTTKQNIFENEFSERSFVNTNNIDIIDNNCNTEK